MLCHVAVPPVRNKRSNFSNGFALSFVKATRNQACAVQIRKTPRVLHKPHQAGTPASNIKSQLLLNRLLGAGPATSFYSLRFSLRRDLAPRQQRVCPRLRHLCLPRHRASVSATVVTPPREASPHYKGRQLQRKLRLTLQTQRTNPPEWSLNHASSVYCARSCLLTKMVARISAQAAASRLLASTLTSGGAQPEPSLLERPTPADNRGPGQPKGVVEIVRQRNHAGRLALQHIRVLFLAYLPDVTFCLA